LVPGAWLTVPLHGAWNMGREHDALGQARRDFH
jgi:hypothetical protein